MRNRNKFSCEYCNADIPILEKTLLTCPACGNPSWPGEVKALARSENKIGAIKVYRSVTNAGLKEAKDAVDGIALKGFLAIPAYYSMPAAFTSTAPTLPQDAPSSLLQELIDFIKKNELIAAIKHYREKSGVGLREAKETVEALRDGKPVKLIENDILAPRPESTAEDIRSKIMALVQQDQALEAIRLYREKTGVSLLEAKNTIDAVRAGQPFSLRLLSSHLEVPPGATKNAEAELLQAIKQGHKIMAVKLYREQTGLGLRESLDAVETIIRGEKKSPLFG